MELRDIAQTVFHYLRVRIITGELKPGQRLNESQLAAGFGISRGPLREALRLLANESLVINVPRKGTFVSSLSAKDIEEVFRSREMVECYALELIRRDGLERVLDSIPVANPRAASFPKQTSSAEEKVEFVNATGNFHKALVEVTGNTWLIKFFQTIGTTVTRCQFIYAFMPRANESAIEDHKELLRLMKKGDYQKADKLLRSHLNEYLKILLKRHSEANGIIATTLEPAIKSTEEVVIERGKKMTG